MFRTFSFPFRRAPGVTRAWGQRMLVRFIVAVPPVLGPRFEQLPRGTWLSVVAAVSPAVPIPAPAAASDTSNGRVHSKESPNIHVECALHGKKRSSSNMKETSPGRWECAKESPCRGGNEVECALHGKKRSSLSMKEATPGRWVCRKESPCSGGKEVECAIHCKKRSSSNMKETSPGRWECPKERPCRGGKEVEYALHDKKHNSRGVSSRNEQEEW